MDKNTRRELLKRLHQARIERENAALGEILPTDYDVKEEAHDLEGFRETINDQEKVLTSDEK